MWNWLRKKESINNRRNQIKDYENMYHSKRIIAKNDKKTVGGAHGDVFVSRGRELARTKTAHKGDGV